MPKTTKTKQTRIILNINSNYIMSQAYNVYCDQINYLNNNKKIFPHFNNLKASQKNAWTRVQEEIIYSYITEELQHIRPINDHIEIQIENMIINNKNKYNIYYL